MCTAASDRRLQTTLGRTRPGRTRDQSSTERGDARRVAREMVDGYPMGKSLGRVGSGTSQKWPKVLGSPGHQDLRLGIRVEHKAPDKSRVYVVIPAAQRHDRSRR